MRKHLKVLNFTASITHKEKWLRRFLELPNGIPSHDRFRRVFMLIDAARFEACFLAWTRRVFSPPEQETLRQIAVDGKTMRRSFDRRKRDVFFACGQRFCQAIGIATCAACGCREKRRSRAFVAFAARPGPGQCVDIPGRAVRSNGPDYIKLSPWRHLPALPTLMEAIVVKQKAISGVS